MRSLAVIIFLIVLTGVQPTWALGGGGTGDWSIGFNGGFINADQKDLNKEIDAIDTGAKNFGNAYEVNGHITYRLSGGTTAVSLRPSYFFHPEESGGGSKFNLSGFTIFPMLKWYMLEDQTIKFYSQYGIGYGHLSGEVEEAGGLSAKFDGGSLGYMAGLGAEFCFAASHCINVEGSVRFLSVDRLTVSNSNAGAGSGTSKITQSGKGQELEIDGRDLSATMSGVLGMVGYILYF